MNVTFCDPPDMPFSDKIDLNVWKEICLKIFQTMNKLNKNNAHYRSKLFNGLKFVKRLLMFIFILNTFAASYLNTQGFNNSCLKSPASTLVDLTFQSRALRSFSLNRLRNLSLRRETYTAASVCLADIIFIPFIVQYAYIAI